MERRRCQRMEPPDRITAKVRASEEAQVVDLSPHGTLLETAAPLAHSSIFPITLSLSTGELTLRGVVRSCRASVDRRASRLVFFSGLEFLDLGADQRERLEGSLVEYCLIEVAARSQAVNAGAGC
jgi:hypothetical protein